MWDIKSEYAVFRNSSFWNCFDKRPLVVCKMCPSEDTSEQFLEASGPASAWYKNGLAQCNISNEWIPIKKKEWGPHRYLRIDTSFLVSRQAEHELMLLHWENHTLKSRDFIFANPYLFQWEVQLFIFNRIWHWALLAFSICIWALLSWLWIAPSRHVGFTGVQQPLRIGVR